MEKDLTAIEILKEFADSTNREIVFSEKQYPVKGIYARPFHLEYAIISSRLEPEVYFVNFSDSKKYGLDAMYSGFFFAIDTPNDFSINIKNKNIIDKLNPFSKKSLSISKYHEFNSKVLVECSDLELATNLFDSVKIQDLIIKTLNTDQRFMLGINNVKIDLVPELENKSVFGFFIAEQWLLDNSINEELFSIIKEFKHELSIHN